MMNHTIGFTTSIPVEIILAAGRVPVDLNNIFITSGQAAQWVEKAEEAGYPRNSCGWIKGLYTAGLLTQPEAVIAVMHGDCSNTQALMETMQLRGIPIFPFAYPYDRSADMLTLEMEKLMRVFQVSWTQVEDVRRDLLPLRQLCQELDRLSWQENVLTGAENHYYLVCSSDFNGDPQKYARDLEEFIARAQLRRPFQDEVRLAYIGVPPIFTNLYEYVESLQARVVYNEIQRQFSMPFACQDIIDQYLQYTYPYGAFARLEDIQEQIHLRQVDGIIHYTQTFCFRQIEDMVFREKLDLPILTLEGDKPGPLDARSKMRIEAFINMLKF
ncbi:MAG TPA: 2-hydroxyacyl-CoA dehydratase [Syntrophomonas sp.]|nr:2-hydroxyacyl-CoA dehydratase [Syntrophomonas sp.]